MEDEQLATTVVGNDRRRRASGCSWTKIMWKSGVGVAQIKIEGVWECGEKLLIDLLASQEANKSISLFGKHEKHF